jgi:transcriptional regulator with XRE-family HTH domain
MDEILLDGDKIRRLRQARRWSQADLARASGVDQGTISRLENNIQEKTRIETLVALARTFGVTADDLFLSSTAAAVDPLNPQLNVMTRLFEDMTEEERDSLEMFARFILAQRGKRWRLERAKSRKSRSQKEE